MKVYSLLYFCLMFVLINTSSQAQNIQPKSTTVSVVKFKQVESLLNTSSDTTYVINFWATWCAPCIKELPDFNALHHKYQNQKVKIILISLDFSDELEKRVIPMVKRKKLKPEVWLLDEADPNTWIDRVESNWQGEIPVTLIVNQSRKYRKFIHGQTHFEELNAMIQPLIE